VQSDGRPAAPTSLRASVPVDAMPVPVWIIGLAELKRSKREAGRPKDLDDLQHLP